MLKNFIILTIAKAANLVVYMSGHACLQCCVTCCVICCVMCFLSYATGMYVME